MHNLMRRILLRLNFPDSTWTQETHCHRYSKADYGTMKTRNRWCFIHEVVSVPRKTNLLYVQGFIGNLSVTGWTTLQLGLQWCTRFQRRGKISDDDFQEYPLNPNIEAVRRHLAGIHNKYLTGHEPPIPDWVGRKQIRDDGKLTYPLVSVAFQFVIGLSQSPSKVLFTAVCFQCLMAFKWRVSFSNFWHHTRRSQITQH